MAKLPSWEELGGGGPKPARGVTSSDFGADMMANASKRAGAAIQGLGDKMERIGQSITEGEAAADALKADDFFTKRKVEISRAFNEDPDYGTYGERAEASLNEAAGEASKMIRNPAMREKWMARASIEGTAAKERIATTGDKLRRQQNMVDVENSLSTWTQDFLDNSKDEPARNRSLQNMEARIEAARAAGQITPSEAQSLKEKHLGAAQELYLERRLLEDPRKALEELKNLGPARNLNIVQAPIQRAAGVGRPRASSVVGLVAHETQGSDTMEGNAAWSNEKGTGANYYIDKQGQIIQWAPDDIAMAHTGKGRGGKGDVRPDLQNNNTLSVEIMTRKGEQPNEAQLEAFRRLAIAKAKEYGFKPEDVEAHGRLAPGYKDEAEATSAVDYARQNWEAGDGAETADASGGMGGQPVSPYAKYLSPARRQALITRSRTALSATLQQSVSDDIERIRNGEEPERDEQGRTSLDLAEGILTPNQLAKLKFSWDEAGMERKALAPLADMNEAEAVDHIAKIVPESEERGESYKNAARVQKKAVEEWKRIKKLRETDPAATAMSDPEVKSLSDFALQKYGSTGVQFDEDGRLTIVDTEEPVMPGDRDRALDLVFNARLDAQERRGIPEYRRKIVTKAEAEELVPDLSLVDEAEVMPVLREAAAAAEAKYGRHAKRAFKDALSLTKLSKDQNEIAAGVVAKMIFDEPVSKLEISRAQAYRGIVRGADSFLGSDAATLDPTAVNPGVPALSQANTDVAAGLASDMGQTAARQPNQAQIEWAMSNPGRNAPIFDLEFGPGAYARAVQSSRVQTSSNQR